MGRTVARARLLDADLLHESVDGEWSFVETLRHLVFATDSWIRRAVLGDPSPWHALSLPWDETADTPGVPRDRMATVRRVADGLTDASLAGDTDPVEARDGPNPAATGCASACCASSQGGVGAPALRRARPGRPGVTHPTRASTHLAW